MRSRASPARVVTPCRPPRGRPRPLAMPAAGLLLLGMLAWIFLVVPEKLQSVYLAIGAALLCLPTLHPWYLIMMAPFLVYYPSAAWIYLQAAAALTFPVLAAELATGIFQEIHWIKLIEYGLFFGLLFYGVFRDGFLFRDSAYPIPRTLSVIVPTLNEAGKLTRCITSLKERRNVPEIIVADGGSTDDTVKLALDMEATVVCGPKGRGMQIRNGSEAATGDLLMVLHADCVLRPGTLTAVFDHLRLDLLVDAQLDRLDALLVDLRRGGYRIERGFELVELALGGEVAFVVRFERLELPAGGVEVR